jgi:hypothetical protein
VDEPEDDRRHVVARIDGRRRRPVGSLEALGRRRSGRRRRNVADVSGMLAKR